MYFVAIVDDTQDAYIPQKKAGKRNGAIFCGKWQTFWK